MNEGNPLQIDLTFEVELEITLDKIECKKIKKAYELKINFMMFRLQNCHAMGKKCFEWRQACHTCLVQDLHKGYG